MDKLDLFMICLFIGSIGYSTVSTHTTEIGTAFKINELDKEIQLQKCLAEVNITQRFRMYSPSLEQESSYVDGIYKTDGENYGFFCVWTYGEQLNDISDTMLHEYLHAAIKQDPDLEQHFCN